MKLLGRRNDDADDDAGLPDGGVPDTGLPDTGVLDEGPGPDSVSPGGASTRTTAPKGRPTPKRNEKIKKRGPVAPAPLTAAEARQRPSILPGLQFLLVIIQPPFGRPVPGR